MMDWEIRIREQSGLWHLVVGPIGAFEPELTAFFRTIKEALDEAALWIAEVAA